MRHSFGRLGFGRLIAAMTVAASAPLAPAQNAGQDGTQPEVAARITIDFGGGTLQEYVASLRNAVEDEPVNIVLSGKADIELPSIMLTGVAVEAAVSLLEHLDLPNWRISVSSTPTAGAAPVFVVRSFKPVGPVPAGAAISRSKDEQQLAVYSLRELLELPPGTPDAPGAKSDATSLLTAVQTALTMGGGEHAPEMKFHPESGVLVIRATPDQTDVVQRLLSAMRDDISRFRAAAGHSRAKDAELEANIARAGVDLQAAYAEVEFAEQEYAQAELLAKEGHLSASDVARAKLTIDQRKANVARAKIMLDQSAKEREAWWAATRRNAKPEQMTADQLRQMIKQVEAQLAGLRADLKKMESTGAR